jgi:hypothetical protein
VCSNPLRAALLASALSLLSLVLPLASATAAPVESSQITVPSGPTYAFNDETVVSSPPAFTVEGTTENFAGGMVELRCYYGSEAGSYAVIAKEVGLGVGGSFKVEVGAKALTHEGPCVLRAVPPSNDEAHPPGTASEEAGDPFKGPQVVGSRFRVSTYNSNNVGYELELASFRGNLDIGSVGECGLFYSNLYAPTTLAESDGLFDCNAALYAENPSLPSSPPSRSELQIDGANAYSPATARAVEQALGATLPGAPQVSVTVEPSNPFISVATVKEVDPIVKCSPSTAYPPTLSSCTSFVSTGVQLERTWQTNEGIGVVGCCGGDQIASMTDTWHSTDGAAHSLNALYDQETVNGGKGGAYQFPGTSVYAATTKGETVTLPPGVGRIYYKEDAETPSETGDGVHPQGAILYDTPTSGPITVYQETTSKEGYNGFVMPYQATIPAGGSYTLRMAFIQAYLLSEVEALASYLADFRPSEPPTLSISSPASGTTVSTPNVTVSGSLSDPRAITSFTVDGQAVSVGAGGAWSTSVPLLEGSNTIKALAVDQAGLSAEKTVSVTYKPIPRVAHAAQVGSAKGSGGEVSFTISCTGSAGTSCEVEGALTTAERTRNGKPVAVAARRHHHPRIRYQMVSVGSSRLTIPAGERVTILIQLNSAGKSLLARFGRLPVRLTVLQIAGGHRSTVIVQNLTVKPHRIRHKRHHHHRR